MLRVFLLYGGTTSGNFVYLYDGTKLQATNNAGQGFDYLGSLVYNKNGANSTLKSAAFGAGRIVKTSTGYDVRYCLTDHLGSVRASINQAGQVVDRSDYQLLGERWSGQGIEATTNRYQFNGKERQMVLAASGGANGNGVDGLNTLDGSHLLDYGARNYDPNIGRWFTPDPLAEKFKEYSPYVFCLNNSINVIDLDGRDSWSLDSLGNVLSHALNKNKDEFIVGDKSISFEYGTVESQKTSTYSPDGTTVSSYDVYQVRGDDNASAIVNFMADNITKVSGVELSEAKTGIAGDKGLNFITTSHGVGEEAGMTNLLNGQLLYGYTIRELNHTHPYSSNPSQNDIGFASQVTNALQKQGLSVPAFHIYDTRNNNKKIRFAN